MKKRVMLVASITLLALVVVIVGVLMFQHFKSEQPPVESTSQDTGEVTQPVEGSYGDVYVNYYGLRIDLSDREVIKGVYNYQGSLSKFFKTFDSYLEFLKGNYVEENENASIVVRVKCTGDIEAKLRPKDYNGLREYVTIPFEVVEVLEVVSGEKSFVNKGDKISVTSDSNFVIASIDNDLRVRIQDNYDQSTDTLKIDLTKDDVKEKKIIIRSESYTWSIIQRIGYEYIIVLTKDHNNDEYVSDITRFAIELSSNEDESSYKKRIDPTSYFRKDTEEFCPKYFEILKRYGIDVNDVK